MQYGVQTGKYLHSTGDFQRQLFLANFFFGPVQTFAYRICGQQKSRGYLFRTQTTKGAQHQCQLGFQWNGRMASRKQHPQLCIFNFGIQEIGIEPMAGFRVGFLLANGWGNALPKIAFTAQIINGAVFGSAVQPGSGIIRQTLEFPAFQGSNQGLLHNVFSDFNLTQAK